MRNGREGNFAEKLLDRFSKDHELLEKERRNHPRGQGKMEKRILNLLLNSY